MRSLLFAATLLASPALAQAACGPALEVFEGIAKKYGELPVFEGLSKHGHRIVILLNRETGTYTALRVTAENQACHLDAGEAGYARPIPLKGEMI